MSDAYPSLKAGVVTNAIVGALAPNMIAFMEIGSVCTEYQHNIILLNECSFVQ